MSISQERNLLLSVTLGERIFILRYENNTYHAINE